MSISGNYKIRKLRYCKCNDIAVGIYQYGKYFGKKQRLQGKMGSSEAMISEMEDKIRNTFLRSVNRIDGCSGAENDMRGIKGDLETLQFGRRF